MVLCFGRMLFWVSVFVFLGVGFCIKWGLVERREVE